jgi:TolB-like protein
MSEPDAPKQSADPPINTPEPPAETQPFVATIQGVWAQIKHHKVVQWTLAYLAIAYTLLHGAEMLAGTFNWSHGVVRIFTLILILGVPLVVTLAWYHGARGLQRVSGTECMIIAILLALGGAFLWRDSTNHEQATETTAVTTPTAALPVVPVAPDDKSIAVLPFVNMSPDKDQDYFADGISEELLNLLTQVPELRVIARTSSFSFKGKEVDIAEIAHKLNVANVLEGSVRKSGDMLRITVQLVRASDSSHLWSQTYDRPMTDVFKVQDQIAATVVGQLKIHLLSAAPKLRVTDPRAYALFLQAREIGRQNTKLGFEKSNNLYQQVLALDPGYVDLLAFLGPLLA